MYKRRNQYTTPMKLLTPKIEKYNGVQKMVYPEDGVVIFGSFITFGGTEKQENNILAIEDTANVETWYRDDIKNNCQIMLENGSKYEILGEPENIERRNQIIKFKVKRVKGSG